jgi:hypothetical protein
MIEGACHCGRVRWRFEDQPQSATACSCTVCRRYGALWAYGYEAEGITLTGATSVYAWASQWLRFHFCTQCACVAYWRQSEAGQDGRRRVGVNLRLAEPDTVAALPIRHHDGLRDHDDLGSDGRCVADMWF